MPRPAGHRRAEDVEERPGADVTSDALGDHAAAENADHSGDAGEARADEQGGLAAFGSAHDGDVASPDGRMMSHELQRRGEVLQRYVDQCAR